MPSQNDLSEFSHWLEDQISLQSAGLGQFRMEGFTTTVLDILEDGDVIRGVQPQVVRAKGRNNRQLELLGYGLEESDNALILLAGRLFDSPEETLTRTEADRYFSSAKAFLEHSIDGWITEKLEPSSVEVEVAEDLQSIMSHRDVAAVRIILVTNGQMSSRIKTIDSDDLDGTKVTYSIWDVSRLHALTQSPTGTEEIVVDFTKWMPDGLPALFGGNEGSGTDTYLAALPGQLVADVFDEYGAQLLESNVRTFLGIGGKVNKSIQSTLKHEPERFLSYNNGLTATATSMEVYEEDGGSTRIASIMGWQIVNGGQTTSSLSFFRRRNPDADLSDVWVQMKLVLVDPEDAPSLVSNVSRYANSQNKVSEADFFSNSDYHRRLERHSRRVLPPAREGEQYRSGWFYERARGQWDNHRRSLSKAKQKAFELEFPKRQRIVKTDWAKYLSSWAQRPFMVSRGAQTNFMDFAREAEKTWDSRPDEVNEAYFKEGVAKAILFQEARSAVMQSDWYESGYLANIVTYAVAKLSLEISRQFPGRSLDFSQIWRSQTIGPGTREALEQAARQMLGVLTHPDRPQPNVTQWAKQETCWTWAREKELALSRSLADELVQVTALAEARKEAKDTQKIDSGFELVQRVMEVDHAVLRQVVVEGYRSNSITKREMDVIQLIVRRGAVPSERQSKLVLEACDRAAREGIIPRDSY